jgi:hypothetical protein
LTLRHQPDTSHSRAILLRGIAKQACPRQELACLP